MLKRISPFFLLFFLSLLLAGCSTSGIYHPVQSGETLGQIARAYGRSETQLARVNGISSPQALPKGKRLFIPGATSVRRTTSTSPVAQPSASAPKQVASKSAPLPVSTKKPQKKTAPVLSQKSGEQKVKSPPKVVQGRFAWPLQGALLRRFGDQIPFPCKGVEIAAPPGTPVLAAADGRVIYSGDGISSFGNMIILQHEGDFYTVYAFAQKIFAQIGSTVRQKERIALSGVPPQGRSPRLYFELRHHKEPVDPTFYLP
ncbi:MAG: M23 family metallopeptidase [Desulfuromonadales bacterium]|nr:M23 family metallopeptidase [Desulfuromonadales bacterium]